MIVFDFEKMNGKDDKSTKEVIKYFTKAGIEVASSELSAIKRTSGISYKELALGFADSQQVIFQIKQTGDIFKVKINGKEMPIKNQQNIDQAIQEIIAKLDKGRLDFQKKLARTKVALPPKIKSTITSEEATLTQREQELDELIANADKTLNELQAK
ncbi:defense against restriction DarA-related protein [Avibacterium paragallinarum]|uniref:Uncharacterized protein n=1 Tax=Avibacterium paragallinarum TaxID=728 RepID=A0A0F5ETV8_AVIPA|nr:hypothetical protein [Avibacterium paragallinarum]AZI14500.1 hypothetical protein EIA51_07670 [Avibacterium paragallinarum]MEE3608276.1 hypothetical protein [Avibacterium paragallinarum]MEE3620801.1 hypothetical protein [Avibacterium paragallinarum]MEE3668102.1 hypothetical protein [Avibacterium paragallinarum]MEE3681374.1 hypothetical protein [Avibacterium paragallinarum]